PAFASPSGPRRWLSWRRVRVAFITSVILALMLSATSKVTPTYVWIARTFTVAMLCLLAFGLCERWPASLPRRLARWVWQLMAIVVTVPVGTFIAYWWTTGDLHFVREPLRMVGYGE